VQCFHVGDGENNVEVAVFAIPPAALLDGCLPGAETLIRCSLHELKAFMSSRII
jgi:hypothetical protein